MIGTRLSDPCGIMDPKEFRSVAEKISTAMTRMFAKPQNGGNPFLFALTASKPHEIAPLSKFHIPEGSKRFDGSLRYGTAGTDGAKFHWDQTYLKKISIPNLTTVMYHEAYHVILYHPYRLRDANQHIANIAFDYVVNAAIEHDYDATCQKFPLWGGEIGRPIILSDLLQHIDGVNFVFKVGEYRNYADKTLFGRSPEGIYAEIMTHIEKSPRKCHFCGALSINPETGKPNPPGKCEDRNNCIHNGLCCPECGHAISLDDDLPAGMDEHFDIVIPKQDIAMDTVRAAEATRTMRGNIPDAAKDVLDELQKPTLSFTDLVRSAAMKKSGISGRKNDYKHYRRRYVSSKPSLYLPRRHSNLPRWIAMIDTSGSMSQDDLTYGISQLQILGNGTSGFIVPCDAVVHWEGLRPIKDVSDIAKTEIIGRGGTVFDDFFSEFPKRLGVSFDSVIIITDGCCGHVPSRLRPPIPVVWVITRKGSTYKPSFGRVAPLRIEKM